MKNVISSANRRFDWVGGAVLFSFAVSFFCVGLGAVLFALVVTRMIYGR